MLNQKTEYKTEYSHSILHLTQITNNNKRKYKKQNKETHKMGAAVAPRGVFPQKHLSVF